MYRGEEETGTSIPRREVFGLIGQIDDQKQENKRTGLPANSGYVVMMRGRKFIIIGLKTFSRDK